MNKMLVVFHQSLKKINAPSSACGICSRGRQAAQFHHGQHLLHWATDMGFKQLTKNFLAWSSSKDVNV
jgi:hypothetical protein